MTKHPYQLVLPAERTTSVVFSSPHSGCAYPRSFLHQTVLDEHTVRSSEDAFVDQLFADAQAFGAPLISAQVPRAYVDLNRSHEELDPAVITGVARGAHNPRVSSGLGVIPRVVANGRAIYRGKITRHEAQLRLSTYWFPYHDTLQALLDDSLSAFGEAILIDCHSMPHEAISALDRTPGGRPEVILGDRFGASAHCEIVDQITAAFKRAGFRVAHNAPFAGAYITQHYGRPSRGQHAIQIEIDRSLYMNEQLIRPNRNFDNFRRTLRGVIAEICRIGHRRIPMAAE
ncbi:N-formylglutamate amidohydrolase [Actibacterium ureilyticum]|uniref:N-formylglutamate amidohydrolase n=1 Tax=Actibacterium ureilyticum TaxID=1590614 RepID=UPI000BAAC320|nr:N-formylglutamate amidohydrolase [Actibacterium ureilyticum]